MKKPEDGGGGEGEEDTMSALHGGECRRSDFSRNGDDSSLDTAHRETRLFSFGRTGVRSLSLPSLSPFTARFFPTASNMVVTRRKESSY